MFIFIFNFIFASMLFFMFIVVFFSLL
jgi:hypothetical protein